MTIATDTLAALLERLTSGVSDAAEPAGAADDIRTVSLLCQIARMAPERVIFEHRTALEMLCRKVAVAKRIWDRYRSDWRKADLAYPVDVSGLLLLAGVLAMQGRPGARRREDELGLALKCLNAAFQAIDLARAQGASSLADEIETAAMLTLDGITALADAEGT